MTITQNLVKLKIKFLHDHDKNGTTQEVNIRKFYCTT